MGLSKATQEIAKKKGNPNWVKGAVMNPTGRKPLHVEKFTYDFLDHHAIPVAIKFLLSVVDESDKDVKKLNERDRVKVRVDAAKVLISKAPDRIAGATGGELFPALPTQTLERIILRHNERKTLTSHGDTINESSRVLEAEMSPTIDARDGERIVEVEVRPIEDGSVANKVTDNIDCTTQEQNVAQPSQNNDPADTPLAPDEGIVEAGEEGKEERE